MEVAVGGLDHASVDRKNAIDLVCDVVVDRFGFGRLRGWRGDRGGVSRHWIARGRGTAQRTCGTRRRV
jgi:hypothetical protein